MPTAASERFVIVIPGDLQYLSRDAFPDDPPRRVIETGVAAAVGMAVVLAVLDQSPLLAFECAF